MPETAEGIAARIGLLVAAAGSASRFGELVGVKHTTALGWMQGTMPYPKNLQRIIEVSGIAREWLESGRGDEAEQIATFRENTLNMAPRRRVQIPPTSDRVCEDAQPWGPFESGAPTMPTDALSWDRIIDEMTRGLPADVIADRLTKILAMRDIDPSTKTRAARRISDILRKRIDAEGSTASHS